MKLEYVFFCFILFSCISIHYNENKNDTSEMEAQQCDMEYESKNDTLGTTLLLNYSLLL